MSDILFFEEPPEPWAETLELEDDCGRRWTVDPALAMDPHRADDKPAPHFLRPPANDNRKDFHMKKRGRNRRDEEQDASAKILGIILALLVFALLYTLTRYGVEP